MDIVLASLNAGKVREFQSYLRDIEMNIIPQSNFKNVKEVAETGTTFVENAIIKARNAALITGLPALADDTGLVVNALNGAPGIHSARYAGNGPLQQNANIEKLLQSLKDIPDDRRDAYFYCVIVLMRNHKDPMPIISEGKWAGKILSAPRGCEGFGYDAVFYDPCEKKSAAELTLTYKNKISHRGIALQCLVKQLENAQFNITHSHSENSADNQNDL